MGTRRFASSASLVMFKQMTNEAYHLCLTISNLASELQTRSITKTIAVIDFRNNYSIIQGGDDTLGQKDLRSTIGEAQARQRSFFFKALV
jgi:hypothetical protein